MPSQIDIQPWDWILFETPYRIIDISQPVNSKSACFPGDVPFSKSVTLTYRDSGIVNLTSFSMSPHVGSHADAPVHIDGDLDDGHGTVRDLPLGTFLGEVLVLDLAPYHDGIKAEQIIEKVGGKLPSRILFKTRHQVRYEIFEDDYAYISIELAHWLADSEVKLIGLDTPSVDHTDSKDLKSHHILRDGGLVWLENLDLSLASEGSYTLVALPLKLEELEAAPVRAVLIEKEAE